MYDNFSIFTCLSRKIILFVRFMLRKVKNTRLFTQKLTGCQTCDTLKHAGEMVWEIKSQQTGGLADVMPLHQQTFRLIDDVVVDVADSRAAGGFVDDIA